MKKELSFLLLFVFLFSIMAISYFAFSFHFSQNSASSKQNAQLLKKLSALQLALRQKTHQPSSNENIKRQIASLPEKQINLDEVYVANLKNLKNSNSVTEENLRTLSEKILQGSSKPQILAETYFLIAEINCKKLKKEDECLAQVETLITQFPESSWTGRGLILLSQLYLKMNRTTEAKAVLKVIKSEFESDPDLAQQVKTIENTQL